MQHPTLDLVVTCTVQQIRCPQARSEAQYRRSCLACSALHDKRARKRVNLGSVMMSNHVVGSDAIGGYQTGENAQANLIGFIEEPVTRGFRQVTLIQGLGAYRTCETNYDAGQDQP